MIAVLDYRSTQDWRVSVEDIERGTAKARQYALEHIAACPPIEPFAAFYHDAFIELRSERALGVGGFGPIPITRIHEYGRHYDLTRHEMQSLKSVVMTLDGHDREKAAKRTSGTMK
ncbi:phage tail assembly chaperone [Sphingobium yanoikuyae]|uniref:phage tail assembly chaperone n=1 Tax=Sphingobium yanoikuyae TaxID=13690 RepID=UPI003EFBB93B